MAEELSPTVRRRRHIIVAVFLALNFALPLSYYVDSDPMDERFAWRMFSPIRMVRCQARLTEHGPGGTVAIDPKGEVPEVWMTWVKRGHERAIRRVATHICERRERLGPAVEIHADVHCALPDGGSYRPVPPAEDLCLH